MTCRQATSFHLLLLQFLLLWTSIVQATSSDATSFLNITSNLLIRRATETDGDGLGGIGDECHETRKPCAEGLACTQTPYLGIFRAGAICFPLECLHTAVTDFDSIINVTGYYEMIFGIAGVTAEEFFLGKEGRAGLRFWSTAYSIAKAIPERPAFQRVIQAILDNPIPSQQVDAYHAALEACDPENDLANPIPSPGQGPSVIGVLGTVGFRFDIGLALGGSVEFFFVFESDPGFFIKLAGGIFIGADVGGAGALGMVFTGNSLDLPGLTVWLDLRAPAPFIHGGGSLTTYSVRPIWGLEFVLGLGVGVHIASALYGHTWGWANNGSVICPTC